MPKCPLNKLICSTARHAYFQSEASPEALEQFWLDAELYPKPPETYDNMQWFNTHSKSNTRHRNN